MKKFLGIIILLTLLSFKCEDEIEFNDNQRLSFRGRVVDFNGEVLNNIPIEIIATRSFFDPYFQSGLNLEEGELAGTGFSDEQGNFSITSLSPLNAEIYAFVNPPESRDFQRNRTSFIVSGIDVDSDLRNLVFRFPNDIVLDRIANFRIQINRITDSIDTLNYSIRYSPLIPIENIEQDITASDIPEINEIGGQLLPTETLMSEDLEMRENDMILFSYSLSSDGIQKDSTITINAENRTFVFEF